MSSKRGTYQDKKAAGEREYENSDTRKKIQLFEELKDIASEILLKELHAVENDFKLYLEKEIKSKS